MGFPRLQLFELEDQPWLPTVVRDLATDYLRFVEARFRLHLHALPVLERALGDSGATRVVDLCSGGAGPVPELIRALRERGTEITFVLTDMYPNLDALEAVQQESAGSVTYVAEPVDARAVPADLEGLRTFFNAFHHFGPRDAEAILRGAVEVGQPIAVLEIPERSVRSILPLLLLPLVVWLVTPFIRPMTWRRLVFTYLLPAVPLVCVWDGVVSQLRAYRPEELNALAERVGGSYRWEAGTHSAEGVPGRLTYLRGCPSEPAAGGL